jgi:hypothetical protein
MAISTVSSLTESFKSGVLLSGEDIALTKDKKSNALDSESTGVNTGGAHETSQSTTTRIRETDGHVGDGSEESDFEDVLEVHG